MPRTEEFLPVFEEIGLDPTAFEANSLCASAPVFRGQVASHHVVLKRTRSPIEVAYALHRWTTRLAESGVDVVVKERSVATNPVQIGDEVWIVYPYVHGRPYSGSLDDVRSAGRLLGETHAPSPDAELAGLPSFSFDSALPETGEVSALEDVLASHDVADAEQVTHRYERQLERAKSELLESAHLPAVVASWDYKANNLVYGRDDRPTLVDPDSAGVVPRVVDLALALLLFHNEDSGAPGRMFSEQEWGAFRSAYTEFVQITEEERRSWPIVLEAVRLDEGLWLIMNDEDGWRRPKQRSFLLDVLKANLSRFVL